MSCYLIQLRDQIFAKGYGCLSFSKKNNSIGKMIRKTLSSKYNKKLLDHAKQSVTDALKTASKAIQKTAEAIYDLITN